MATISQGRSAGPDYGVPFATPRLAFIQTDLPSLVGADLQQIGAFERELYTNCPCDFARSVARDLSRGVYADSAGRLEGALREFSELVVREIVRQIDRDKYGATVAKVFTYGKEILNSGDAAIEDARDELGRRGAAA